MDIVIENLREPLAHLVALPASVPALVGQMNLLAIGGGLLGLAVFVPLCLGVWKREITQSIATFALWGVLDGINASSTYAAEGNYLLPAFYALGSVAVVACIMLRNRSIVWTFVETFCTLMVVICIMTWLNWGNQQLVTLPFSTEQMVIILSTVALVIAGLPQLVKDIKIPQESAPWSYLAFTAANALSTAAGSSWSIEERLYGASCTVLTLLIFIAGTRKWPNQAQAAPAN